MVNGSSTQLSDALKLQKDATDGVLTKVVAKELEGSPAQKEDGLADDQASFEAEVEETLGKEFNSDQEDADLLGQPYLQSFDCPDLV